jgi:thiol-disulfide isomerase/thioredoxin
VKTSDWIEKEQFEKEILKSPMPKLVLFAADWCGYCRRFLDMVSSYEPDPKLSESERPELAIVNVESGDGSLWDTYKVNLVPTLVVFSSGKEIFRRDAKPLKGLGKQELDEALISISSFEHN